jgi:hypothetical protein
MPAARGCDRPRNAPLALIGPSLSGMALALILAAPLPAQALPPAPAPVDAASLPPPPDQPLGQRPWTRPVGSLLLPGAGQLLAHQPRGLVYLAAELWIVARVVESARDGRQGAGRFRSLAFDVARRAYAPASREDGNWDYYETMEKFVESGAYNRGTVSNFLPELDPSTYNGSVWRLARHTFLSSPDSAPDPASPAYVAAIAFYQAHAISDALRWSWRGARLEQDLYRQEIKASDDAYRARTNYLGALVLNHVASAIDALISVRLGARRPVVPRLRFGPTPQDLVVGWSAEF